MDIDSQNDFGLFLKQKYGLTNTQANLCSFLSLGNGRSDLIREFNLSENALKQHLKQVYARMLAPEGGKSRDKFQRITVLLMQIRSNWAREFRIDT